MNNPIDGTEIEPHSGGKSITECLSWGAGMDNPQQWNKSNPGEEAEINLRKRKGEQNAAEESATYRSEPIHSGKTVAWRGIKRKCIGEYEIDRDKMAALKRAKAKRAEGPRYLPRVGYNNAKSELTN